MSVSLLHMALFATLLLTSCFVGWSIDDNLAPVPPMGYNTWNAMACMTINETNVRKTATTMKELGFLDLGYRYFTIDDCWMAMKRDEDGNMKANGKWFPSGMEDLSERIRSLGFKLGIYTDRGEFTCAGRPASQGHEEADAKTFARWQVDFIKNDACADKDCWAGPLYNGKPAKCNSTGREKAIAKYSKMQVALNQTGRGIVHSISGWQPWYAEAGRNIGHMWRIGDDVRGWGDVYEATRLMDALQQYNGRNGWNDPDMLLGSSPGADLSLPPLQSRAQFTLWVVMGAPLMLGLNMLNVSDFDRETYGNAEAIAVNQDPLGAPGAVVFSNCPAYPKFKMGSTSEGRHWFNIDTSHMEANRTSCGRFSARDCTACLAPRFSKKGKQLKHECGGHCFWQGSVNDTNRSCLQKTPLLEDMNEAFARGDLLSRECQQVWVKPLQSGEVALGAVNFAQDNSTFEIPLASLVLPWQRSQGTVLRDLWSKESGGKSPVAAVTKDTIQFNLMSFGGHALIKLSGDSKQSFLKRSI